MSRNIITRSRRFGRWRALRGLHRGSVRTQAPRGPFLLPPDRASADCRKKDDEHDTGNDRRRNGDPGARRPGREAPVRLSGRRGAADLRRAVPRRDRVRHVLVRHEQGAVHAAEGYARSTGKVGCVLVTSGPGATNAVTGITDALMDSIPLVCITGQVPTHLIGNDAFQECRHRRHHAAVHQAQLPGEAASRTCRACCTRRSTSPPSGRPGPVVIDIPKDVQFAKGAYSEPEGCSAHRLQAAASRATSSKIKRGRRADGATPSGRCSTPAAASSIPARRRATCCANWPSSPARRSPRR